MWHPQEENQYHPPVTSSIMLIGRAVVRNTCLPRNQHASRTHYFLGRCRHLLSVAF